MEMVRSSASTPMRVIVVKIMMLICNDNDSNDDYPIKIISIHKCTYCLAEFKNEEKKKKHELKWHI